MPGLCLSGSESRLFELRCVPYAGGNSRMRDLFGGASGALIAEYVMHTYFVPTAFWDPKIREYVR